MADKRSFSNQNLRKEINLLAKTSSKKKILEMYASVIKREKAKLDEMATRSQRSARKLWQPRVKVMMKCQFKSSELLRLNLKRKSTKPLMLVLRKWNTRRRSSG
jgi:hypothetical protein